MSRGTLCYGNEQVAGYKECKDRITLLFVTNATGNDKFIYSIGKSKKPRCFRNRVVPIEYFANKNAWMTQTIWSNIIVDLNKKMKTRGKKIILFVDNATCHNVVTTADYVKTVFLPPNTTSLIQPLDQGIIRSFKATYRQNLVINHLLHIESGGKSAEFIKQINIFEALKMAKGAWYSVTPTTIKNCFKKAHFSSNSDTENLIEILEDVVISHPLNDAIQDLIDIDCNLECYGTMTDEEIIASQTYENDCEPETEIDEFETINPTLSEAYNALTTLKYYFATKKSTCLSYLDEIEDNMAKANFKILTQKKINDYFQNIAQRSHAAKTQMY